MDGKIRAQDQFILPSYDKSSLPTGVTGGLIYVNNATGGAEPAFYDGSDWRRCSDRTVIN
ncbi:MAG: hypothetical protein ABIA63_10555 [bacterium]